jgi:hypothetical protein
MVDHKNDASKSGFGSTNDQKERDVANEDGWSGQHEKRSFTLAGLAAGAGQKGSESSSSDQNEGQDQGSARGPPKGEKLPGRPGLGGYGSAKDEDLAEHNGPQGRPGLGGYGEE